MKFYESWYRAFYAIPLAHELDIQIETHLKRMLLHVIQLDAFL